MRFAFAVLIVWVATAVQAQEHVRPVGVRVQPIERFHPFSNAVKFGQLEFLGGLQIASDDPLFGGLSGLRLLGNRMVAISDAGYWFDAWLERTSNRLTGLRDMRITPMLDASGKPFRYKAQIDAEGLALAKAADLKPGQMIKDETWIVSTERDIRLLQFKGDPFSEVPVRSGLAWRPSKVLRGNRALEAVAIGRSAKGPLLVTFSEDTQDAAGNIVGFVGLTGETFDERQVSVRKRGSYAITDAAFLPNGDLLLLERRFNLASGPGMRIRRVRGVVLAINSRLDGEVLIEVGLPHQIDNMEGLAVSPHPEGHRLTLVSDDNRSLLQRTLLLEFLLRD